MTYDATNRKHIRDAEKSAKLLDDLCNDFIIAAMSTSAGRAFFYRLLAETSPFVDAPAFDPHRDYFTSGRRSVGLQHLASILLHCPDQYTTMMQEANARDLAAAQRTRSPNAGGDAGGSEPEPEPEPDLFDPYGGAEP